MTKASLPSRREPSSAELKRASRNILRNRRQSTRGAGENAKNREAEKLASAIWKRTLGEEDERLTISFHANAENNSRRRRPARRNTNAKRGLAAFAPHPALARAGFCLAIAFAAFGVYQLAEAIYPTRSPSRSEAPRPIVPTPPPRQAAIEDERASQISSAATARASHNDETATPARLAPQAKPIVAQRDPALEAWLVKSYLRCWTPPSSLPQGEKYAAKIRVAHNVDGSFSTPPRLVNPPSDPEWRAYADSALRAVAKCNPLEVPARFASRFDEWKKTTLYFSPDDLH